MARKIMKTYTWPIVALTTLLQTSSTSAQPYAATFQVTTTVSDPDCYPERLAQSPTSKHQKIAYHNKVSTDVEHHPHLSWYPTAYEIADGQVQAPQTVPAFAQATSDQVEPTRSITSATLVTRGEAVRTTSTSLTTVYVYASPWPYSGSWQSHRWTRPFKHSRHQHHTKAVPDGSLTSLTTSEVQSVTVSPLTDTTGVSSIIITLLRYEPCKSGLVMQNSTRTEGSETSPKLYSTLRCGVSCCSSRVSSRERVTCFDSVS